MAITLTPELEAIARQNASNSGFDSPEAYLEALLTEPEIAVSGFHQSLEEIRAAIDEGWEQAQRGELLTPEEVRESLARMKAEWFAARKA
jgi:predicted transcriptional regulator